VQKIDRPIAFLRTRFRAAAKLAECTPRFINTNGPEFAHEFGQRSRRPSPQNVIDQCNRHRP
jgi:hypothetical protein